MKRLRLYIGKIFEEMLRRKLLVATVNRWWGKLNSLSVGDMEMVLEIIM